MPVKTITATAEQCVLRCDAIVGESPLWHVAQQRLYWVDIQGKKVFRFDPFTGHNEAYAMPDIVSCLAFRAGGGLVLLLRKNVAFFDPDTGSLDVGRIVEADQPGNRFNDGRVDPQGRLWAGTMGDKDWDAPVGHLYRITPELYVATAVGDVTCSNGTGWSPDGRTMYHTETFRYTVWAHDFDPVTGGVSNKRPFATLPKGKVFPDGLCVDAEGFVWSNHVGAGQVVRYDPAGRIERQVQLPVPRGCGSTFGGPDLSTLYVTTARETMSAAELAAAPLSGSLFAIDVGVRGKPATPFAG